MNYPRDLPALATPSPMRVAMPVTSQQYASPGMSLLQIALILWAHKTASILIAGLVVSATALGTRLWPKTYEATTTLMVNFEVNDPLAGREFPVGLLGSYMSTQVELLRGSEVLLEVIDLLDLAQKKEYVSGYLGNEAGLRHWVEFKVRKKLTVEQGRFGSQLIHVTYAARTPLEAAQVANAVADAYSSQQYRMLTGPATERAKRYTAQLDELREKVSHAQKNLSDFRQRSGLVDVDSRVDVDMHATLIQTLKAQHATQSMRLAELSPTLGERHPQIMELQSQIAATLRALYIETRAFSNKASSEIAGSKYQLEFQSAQASYARALDGYDQIMLASSGGYSNVNLVSRAVPPPKPSKPKTMMILLLSCVIGAALGIAIPFVYEMLNRRVRCRDDLERDYGIPVLAEMGPASHGKGMMLQGAA